MEILIILAVALIFVGPDQLPKVARQIGKGVRQVRGAMGKVDDEMRRAVREAAAEFDDDGEPIAPRTPPTPTTPPAAPDAMGSPSGLLPDAQPEAPGRTLGSLVEAGSRASGSLAEAAPVVTTPTEVIVSPGGPGTPQPNAAPKDRDWSQIGKAPVPGAVGTSNRVASGAPARPAAPPDAPADTAAMPTAPPPVTTTTPPLPSDPASAT